MKRLPSPGLDFVARPRAAGPLGWLLLAAGVAVASAVALDWQAADDDAAHWAGQAEHWQSMARRAGGSRTNASAADVAALQPQVEAAARAVARLGMPWGDLYRSLEESQDETVALLAVMPNAEKGELRLSGEAKDFAALRAYLRRLGASTALADVRLLGQEVKQSDAQHPVVFSIAATWRRPT